MRVLHLLGASQADQGTGERLDGVVPSHVLKFDRGRSELVWDIVIGNEIQNTQEVKENAF